MITLKLERFGCPINNLMDDLDDDGAGEGCCILA
jgi:hypothetical protein